LEGIRAHFGQVQDDVDVEDNSDHASGEHNVNFEAISEEEIDFAGFAGENSVTEEEHLLFSDQSPF
jgi:hypothetical protein